MKALNYIVLAHAIQEEGKEPKPKSEQPSKKKNAAKETAAAPNPLPPAAVVAAAVAPVSLEDPALRALQHQAKPVDAEENYDDF